MASSTGPPAGLNPLLHLRLGGGGLPSPGGVAAARGFPPVVAQAPYLHLLPLNKELFPHSTTFLQVINELEL